MRRALAAVSFAACVGAPTAALAQEGPPDPWEDFNRNMFAVHETVDRAVLEPVARGYRAVTPQPVRNSVRNFLRNLRSPVVLANDLLQGEGERAGTTMARLTVNTTIGLFGLFDPATGMGFERHEEDFGQTLAVWGVGAGPYIFVPLLGPTTVRDGAGRIFDIAFDPLTWVGGEDVQTARLARGVITGVSARESVIEAVDTLRRDAVDPYVSIRTSYGLLRESAIQNGRADVQDLPDFDDNFDMPEDTPTPGENQQHSDSNETPNGDPSLDPTAPAPKSPSQAGEVS